MKIIPLLKRYDFPTHKVMKGLAKIKDDIELNTTNQ